jgi:hypothetical protein
MTAFSSGVRGLRPEAMSLSLPSFRTSTSTPSLSRRPWTWGRVAMTPMEPVTVVGAVKISRAAVAA